MSNPNTDDHWLVRPKTIRYLWYILYGVLALTVLAQIFIKVKGYVGVDGWFGFGAIFGFASCLAMVLFAKLLGMFLKRDEEYYKEDETTEGGDNA
ncbi:hypothetical protein FLL45_08205 [Aliikangiella marina]|uniref:Uncharacterized protein n=1 Tax=Aliikangiella marina TaxID=1712262 RepID=A0A545TCL2_9GAMM|nr:hypothetical protein [Aliikangiella marina]TQV74931.1 hypothetical protein FLL45_08205 [Aliikangiella marina]